MGKLRIARRNQFIRLGLEEESDSLEEKRLLLRKFHCGLKRCVEDVERVLTVAIVVVGVKRSDSDVCG